MSGLGMSNYNKTLTFEITESRKMKLASLTIAKQKKEKLKPNIGVLCKDQQEETYILKKRFSSCLESCLNITIELCLRLDFF